jgi:hypothetical protein
MWREQEKAVGELHPKRVGQGSMVANDGHWECRWDAVGIPSSYHIATGLSGLLRKLWPIPCIRQSDTGPELGV